MISGQASDVPSRESVPSALKSNIDYASLRRAVAAQPSQPSQAQKDFLRNSRYGAGTSAAPIYGSQEGRERQAMAAAERALAPQEAAAQRASEERIVQINANAQSMAAQFASRADALANFGSMTKDALAEGTITQDELPAMLDAYQRALAAKFNQGNGAMSADANGDGQISPAEQKFNRIQQLVQDPNNDFKRPEDALEFLRQRHGVNSPIYKEWASAYYRTAAAMNAIKKQAGQGSSTS